MGRHPGHCLLVTAPSAHHTTPHHTTPPLLEAPTPHWRLAPKDWALGAIHPCTSTVVIKGREAKTTREQVVYQWGRAIQLTMAMEDVMATLGWAVVLLVCEQPINDPPSNTRLHRLLVGLLNIQVHWCPPLHACLQEHLHVAKLP